MLYCRAINENRPPNFEGNQPELTLSEYLLIAEKLIRKHTFGGLRHHMVNSEDAISFVAYQLAYADVRYRDGLGTNMRGYRYKHFQWAIGAYVRGFKAHRRLHSTESLNKLFHEGDDMEDRAVYKETPLQTAIQNEDSRDIVERLMDNAQLSNRERDFVKLWSSGVSKKDIPAKTNVSYQRFHQILTKAMNKMRAATAEAA